jgi:hypothetical protein
VELLYQAYQVAQLLLVMVLAIKERVVLKQVVVVVVQVVQVEMRL